MRNITAKSTSGLETNHTFGINGVELLFNIQPPETINPIKTKPAGQVKTTKNIW